jgi:hypothetical protein
MRLSLNLKIGLTGNQFKNRQELRGKRHSFSPPLAYSLFPENVLGNPTDNCFD